MRNFPFFMLTEPKVSQVKDNQDKGETKERLILMEKKKSAMSSINLRIYARMK